jgi:hypothetical protein
MMAAISWNPSSFWFAIFPFHFPLKGLAWELHGEIFGGGCSLEPLLTVNNCINVRL